MIADADIPFRLIVAAELLAMAAVRAYYSLSRAGEPVHLRSRGSAEAAWLTATLSVLAALHFGAVLVYVARPSLLGWSLFEVAVPIRWTAILISCSGAACEISAAISLGASYSPLLRAAKERGLVTAGVYKWIRHPLYAFALPLMGGWGVAARNWFIIASAAILIPILMIIRAPREEAMLLDAFGESYREYMARTGRFLPRLRSTRGE